MQKYLKYPFLLFFALCALSTQAQDYDDDDLGFDATSEEVVVEKREEAEVRVNEKLTPLTEEMTFEKSQKLDIWVKYLKPYSKVHVEISKAGKVLSRQSFDANEKGELNLEINTGNQKIGGTAELRYTTSSGKNLTRNFRVMVR
ncbi:MAG: hypothetical protein KF690_06400 [Bacteroidetes bacterium]|nr:hypothetical protein [Bacteroidota bacterium]